MIPMKTHILNNFDVERKEKPIDPEIAALKKANAELLALLEQAVVKSKVAEPTIVRVSEEPKVIEITKQIVQPNIPTSYIFKVDRGEDGRLTSITAIPSMI